MKRTQEQIDLAVATLQYIEAHPDEWDQRHWRCRTGMCFAGHAAMLAGGKWLDPSRHSDDRIIVAGEEDIHGTGFVSASTFAWRRLGLGVGEIDSLFNAYNTIDNLREMVAKIAAGKSIPWVDEDDEED